MDYSISGIDPASIMAMSPAQMNAIRNNEEASKAFVSYFLTQILKDVMESQNSLFGDDQNVNAFSKDLYNEILLKKITDDMSQNNMFGFDDIMGAGIKGQTNVKGNRNIL